MKANTIAIAIHGGAGTILRSEMTEEQENTYRNGLQIAINIGYDLLSKGCSAIEAVIAAVQKLEDNPKFNAGKGSVYTHKGVHEMDAAIMCGDTLRAGAVANVRNIRNPVLLANAVMNDGNHVFLAGKGASEFALKCHLQFEPDEYFFDELRYSQWMVAKKADKIAMDHISDKKFGTVGAVALDKHGNIAAATSTGGMTNKRYGRVGDSPLIGAGTYANNNTCAISCTGHGEFFIRSVVAYDISCLMEYKGLTVKEACAVVVHEKLPKIGGEGGLIALDVNGNIELVFNSEGMYRASAGDQSGQFIGIYKD